MYFKLSSELYNLLQTEDWTGGAVKQAIDTARPELEKHRGSKEILNYIVKFIQVLSFIFAVPAYWQYERYLKTGRRHILFQLNTDSAKVLDKLETEFEYGPPKAVVS